MFWNMDVGEQEQDLMEISHFLLSVFEFAKNQPGRYLEGEYMKWIANKQLKAFYEELKK